MSSDVSSQFIFLFVLFHFIFIYVPLVYTRPADYKGWKVPDILLSGNDKLIDKWRFEQSLERTHQRRPNLLNDNDFQ